MEPYDFEQTADAICALTQDVTAIFAPTDLSAIRLISLLKKRGRRIPEDYPKMTAKVALHF